MNGVAESSRKVAEAMLAMTDPAGWHIADEHDGFAVTIGGARIVIGDGAQHAFERLAAAIEARIAFDRAHAMVAATGEEKVPLWLVSGSSVLAQWLAWSRKGRVLARQLALTDRVGLAPIVGQLARRTRRAVGQVSIRIRVSAGQAVAERIELSHKVPAIATFADKAMIRVRRHHLPDTVINALGKDPARNDRLRAADLIDHPFFAATDVMVADVRNDGKDMVVELETVWQPLQPVPEAAWAIMPGGADPIFPWRATASEVAALYELATRGGRMMQGYR